MELLKTEGLTKVIGKKTIVDNVSITVNSGEIVGFLGPNGAGKTTTIKMILGLYKITAGEIFICGHSVKTDFEQALRNAGGIIESPDLYKRMTGRQNLEYLGAPYGKEALDNIDSVAELVKMSGRLDDKIKKYSLGMRQRIGVAQAILHMPRLLVLDEPTNGLDPIGIKELRDLFKKLAKENGVGVLVSSHLLPEMELMCDRIYIIDNGRLIGERTIESLDSEQESEIFEYQVISSDSEAVLAYFRELNSNCFMKDGAVHLVMRKPEVPGIIAELVHRNIQIYAFSQLHRTLEDDFISMTAGSKDQIR